MCHHYIQGRDRTAAGRAMVHYWDDEFSIRSNLRQLELPEGGFYPLKPVPVVRLDDNGERELVLCEWGLLPFWWKPSADTPKRTAFQRKTSNARSETVSTTPSYRDAFKRRRCLLPAGAFEEKAHYFSLPSGQPFAFAGLWESWGRGDERIESCTLLTTLPNEEVRGVGHHRMPVILQREAEYARWLDPETSTLTPFEELLRPLADGSLAVAPKG